MSVFKISQDEFMKVRKKTLMRSIPMLIIAGAVGIAISTTNSKEKDDDVNILPIVIPILVVALGFGIYTGVNRQRAQIESYRLIIDNNIITREQLNTPTISIHFSNINEIVKHKNRGFTIIEKETRDLIIIPAQIEDYLILETTLQQIHPISARKYSSLLDKYQNLAGLTTLGLMFCVYTVNNKLIIALSGSALVILLIWSFIKIRKSKNIDSKIKRNMWWGVLLIISVISVILFKLTGFFDV